MATDDPLSTLSSGLIFKEPVFRALTIFIELDKDVDAAVDDSTKGGIIVVPLDPVGNTVFRPLLFSPIIPELVVFPAIIVFNMELLELLDELLKLELTLGPPIIVLIGFCTTVLQMLNDDGNDGRLLIAADKLPPLFT